MKILFNIFLILVFLIVMVPVFRRFLFHLLVGRQLVREQKKMNNDRKPAGKSGVNVDYVPPDANQRRYKGGDYVDYEEVKE